MMTQVQAVRASYMMNNLHQSIRMTLSCPRQGLSTSYGKTKHSSIAHPFLNSYHLLTPIFISRTTQTDCLSDLQSCQSSHSNQAILSSQLHLTQLRSSSENTSSCHSWSVINHKESDESGERASERIVIDHLRVNSCDSRVKLQVGFKIQL